MEAEGASQSAPAPAAQPPPPPSPLSGAYLLIIVGEPQTDPHKEHILTKITNGFLSWDKETCHVDLDKELQNIIVQAPEGEEARNGERLIQFASESLVTEVLIQPQLNTLIQCIRNLLSSFTKHRHIIHAGYTFAGNGSWIVQDGTFSLADLIDAFQEPEVQRVLRAYENSVTVDIHCAPEGEWSTARLRRESFTKLCRVRVNPDDSPSPASNIHQFVDYLSPFIQTASLEQLLEPSDVVGNIRFSHPTLYVFPGGQGDAALFGINGFNMLVDGGFARKACFWDFVRHLDRLDAVLMTRINNSNINGLASVLRRKKLSHVYPQIGHFFSNLQERKQPSTPEEEKVRDPLLISLLGEGQEIVQNLRHLQMKPHICVRDNILEPINLYHKVGHGKLDMYVLSPSKDSKELKEFLTKWHSNDNSLFTSVSKKPTDKDFIIPLQNLVSVCALLVWQPANPEDTITRILFPGSTPQHKIFEGLEKLRSLEFMKTPICTAKTLSPSSSTIGISSKVNKTKSTPAVIDKLLPGEGLSKPVPRGLSQTDSAAKQSIAKTATIPVSGANESKPKLSSQKLSKPKQEKPKPDNKTDDKNIDNDSNKEKANIISEQAKEKDQPKVKTEKQKIENKSRKGEPKATSKVNEKKLPKSSSIEKKDSVKSSPTTPKKSVEAKLNGAATKTEIIKSSTKTALKTKLSPSSTPAKSAKEENNRKVVESKVKAAITAKPTTKVSKKEEIVPKSKPEKKLTKKPSSTSPAKPLQKAVSPIKLSTKPISKGKRDSKKVKGDSEKGIITDSSTVSTPSTVDAETAITKEVKSEVKQLIEDKEAVIEPAKDIGDTKTNEEQHKEAEELPEEKEKADEPSISEDIVNEEKPHEKQVEISEKELSEKEEEDEILIIEKVEIEQFGDESMHDQESLESHIPDEVEDEIQKHLRDEAESEKKKDDKTTTDGTEDTECKEKETVLAEEKDQQAQSETVERTDTDVSKQLNIDIKKDVETEKVLSPENREQIEEEVQEIITSATDFVAKAKMEQSKESSELSAEGIGSDEQKTSGEAKDILSSPEKLNAFSDKNLTDDAKDKSREMGDVKYGAEESQPDEKFSTTVESGATTAPTLPEDERIPLDEIKEGVEEKYDKEETKEKEVGEIHTKIELPTTLPQVSIIPGAAFETQTNQLLRDIVKTPDEVADLPVHEEVDGVYEEEDIPRDALKSKDDLLNIVIGKKVTREDDKVGISGSTADIQKEDNLGSVVNGSTGGPQESVQMESDKTGKLPIDVKEDEDELNELKMIRQKLEEEDSKPITSSVVPKEENEPKDSAILIDQADRKKSIDLPVKEEVVEEQLIHTMLKAPEKAELVVVTPDSAPDSPLHLKGDKSQKTTADLDVVDDGAKPSEEKLEQVVDVKKDEGSPTKIVSEQIELNDGKGSINIETLAVVENLPSTILNESERDDLILIENLKSGTPRTPPASPIVADNDKTSKDFAIIPDSSLFLSDQLQSSSLIGSKLQEVEEAPMEEEMQEELVADLTRSAANAVTSALDSKQSVLPQETNLIKDDNIETKEKEDELLGKQESQGKDGPTASGKETMETIKVEEEVRELNKSATPKSLSPIPSESDNVKTVRSSSPLIEKVTVSDNLNVLEIDQTSGAPEEVVLKGSSPPPSNENIDKDEKLQTVDYSDKVTKEEIKDASDEEGKGKVDVEETDKTGSPIPTVDNTTKYAAIEDEVSKLDIPKSPSPISSERGVEKNIDSEHIGTPQSLSPIPSDKGVETTKVDDPACTVSSKTTPKSASPVPSDKDFGLLVDNDVTQTHPGEIDIPKSVSPVPTGKDIKIAHALTNESETPKSISPVPSDKDIVKVQENEITQAQSSKPETPASVSPVPSDKDFDKSVAKEKTQGLSSKPESPKSISPVPDDKDIEKMSEITSADAQSSKANTPKRTSPVPIGEETDKIVEKENVQEKLSQQETPKSVSPVPVEKDIHDTIDNVSTQDLSNKSETLGGVDAAVSSIKAPDITMDSEKPQVPTEKSTSPVPSEKEVEKTVQHDISAVSIKGSESPIISKTDLVNQNVQDECLLTQDGTKTLESSAVPTSETVLSGSITCHSKPASPKSDSPVPDVKDAALKVTSNDSTMPLSVSETPTSASPIPGEPLEQEKYLENKSDIGVSKVQSSEVHLGSSQEDNEEKQKNKDTMPLSESCSPKVSSPVLTKKECTQVPEDIIKSSGKTETPTSVSPIPNENDIVERDDEKPDIGTSLPIEKTETQKSSSPTPIIDVSEKKTLIDEVITPSNRPDYEDSKEYVDQVKNDSLVSTEIDGAVGSPKEDLETKTSTSETTILKSEIENESPKSTSPVRSKELDAKQSSQFSPETSSTVSTEKISDSQITKSSVPTNTDTTCQDSADNTVLLPSKEISSFSSKEDDLKSSTPELIDGKNEPKSVKSMTPEPLNGKELTETPKSISPEPYDDKERTKTSKSVTPEPTDGKDVTRTGESPLPTDDKERVKTPHSTTPEPTFEKELTKTPKSASPEPTVDKEQLKTPQSATPEPTDSQEKTKTPKSITPEPKVDQDRTKSPKSSTPEPTDDKESTHTSKSLTPEPTEVTDSKKAFGSEPIEKTETPKSITPEPTDDKEKAKTPKSITPEPTDDKDKAKTPKSITPEPSDDKEKAKTPKSITPEPTDDKEKAKTPKSITPEPTDDKEKAKTPKSITPEPTDERIAKSLTPEPTDAQERVKTPGSTTPEPTDEKTAKSITPEPTDDKEINRTSKSVTPEPKDERIAKSITPDPTDEKDVTKSSKSITPEPMDDKENTKTPKSITPELTNKKETISSPKCITPELTDDGEGAKTLETIAANSSQEKPSSPTPSQTTSSLAKGTDEEKVDTPKGVLPDLDKIASQSILEASSRADEQQCENKLKEKEVSKDEISNAEEKAELESSEKQSEKSDVTKFDSQRSSISNQEVLKEGLAQESSSNGADYCQEKGILESLETEKCVGKGYDDVSKDIYENSSSTKVSSSLQDDNIPNKILDITEGYINKSTIGETSLDINIGSQSGSPEKSFSDKCDTSTGSTCVSQQLPLNGHSNKASELSKKENETEAVTGKSLECKNIKTAEIIDSEPESKVPSTDLSCDLESEAREILSSIDSGVSSLKTNTSDRLGFQSDSNLNESKEFSSSVHRMLVTGSSEDGGTETELCSSSVTRISSDSYDKQLGNVSHLTSTDTVLEERSVSPDELTSTEKTVITTTHPVTTSQQVPDSIKEDSGVKTITTIITKSQGEHPVTEVKTIILSQKNEISSDFSQKETSFEETKPSKTTGDLVTPGVLAQTLKKDVLDTGRSGTPASDIASEKEFDIGGPGTPHSDISSGQVSRAATNVWGESSEGRPDSRHYESDDDIPCSPMSATSHIAQSPPQFDFDVHQQLKESFYEEGTVKGKEPLSTVMTSSFYGGLPEDPLEEYLRNKKQTSGESQMFSSMYVSKYDDDDDSEDEPLKLTGGKAKFEDIFSAKKEDIDFETAVKEHVSTRGDDLTAKFTTGMKDVVSNGKSEVDAKPFTTKDNTNGHLNGKGSQPESLEDQSTVPLTSAISNVSPKAVSSQSPGSTFSVESTSKPEEKKDPIEGWGKPLGLPPPPKNLLDSPLSRSTLELIWNPADEWGIPLGLPSPAPPPAKKDSLNGEIDTEITSTSNKTTPKKVAMRNAENKSASNATIGKEANYKSKHPESPVKRTSNKDAKSRSVTPVYMDLTYVPHHGNSHYTTVEFFKRVRARYYVFSGTEPSREVFNALLEAKQTWEDKDLEVTIIPTYDTDTLGYWVAENEDILAKYKIDLSPSASRCTINLQDHETSCSAYRLEF